MTRRLLLLLAAACAVSLAGCGSGTSAPSAEGTGASVRYGLVTGTEGTSGSAENSALSGGIESYAAENASSAGIYTASADTVEALEEQFNNAAADGAVYIVCRGEKMEVPVYEAQNRHHDRQFLLFDGEPRQSGDMEATIRSNTESVRFNKAQMGFLAGYAAVRDGYRNLLFMASENAGDTELYYRGFLSGVDYAVSEQGLVTGSVSVSAEFALTDALTPLRMTDAVTQYDLGTELILTDAVGIARAVEHAAENRGKAVATIGFDDTETSASVVYSVVPDYEGTVRYLLDSFEHSKGFEGGRSLLCGAKEQAIGFSADDSRLRAFSVDGSAGILEALADGTAGSGLPGQDEDGEQEETAVTEDYSFVVNEVQPVTPDPEAGMTEAVSPDAAQSAETGTASDTEGAADTAEEAAETAEGAADTAEEADEAAAEEADETASEEA